MGKITDYSEVAALLAANVFLIDGADGTKKITAQNVATGLAGLMQNDPLFAMLDDLCSPYMHSMIYRGKNLGTSITAAQKAQIQAGTFKDLWLGDYWRINSVDYVIVDFDYWYNCGDGNGFTSHHVVVMPSVPMYNAKMNDSNTTVGGYYGSKMRGVEVSGTFTPYAEGCGLYSALTSFQSAFGSALLTHREYLVNAVTNGKASGGAWVDSIIDIPNEIMMYGCPVFTPGCDGTTVPANYTIGKTQLALMRVSPKFIMPSRSYNTWLRDVVSEPYFACVHLNGTADCSSASYSRGVRPVAAVG